MTPAASGSAPPLSPHEAKAAPGLGGEAFLARIVNPPLLPLDAFTRDLPHVKLLGTAEWNVAEGPPWIVFTMETRRHQDTEKINNGKSKGEVFSVPLCLRGEMLLPSDF